MKNFSKCMCALVFSFAFMVVTTKAQILINQTQLTNLQSSSQVHGSVQSRPNPTQGCPDGDWHDDPVARVKEWSIATNLATGQIVVFKPTQQNFGTVNNPVYGYVHPDELKGLSAILKPGQTAIFDLSTLCPDNVWDILFELARLGQIELTLSVYFEDPTDGHILPAIAWKAGSADTSLFAQYDSNGVTSFRSDVGWFNASSEIPIATEAGSSGVKSSPFGVAFPMNGMLAMKLMMKNHQTHIRLTARNNGNEDGTVSLVIPTVVVKREGKLVGPDAGNLCGTLEQYPSEMPFADSTMCKLAKTGSSVEVYGPQYYFLNAGKLRPGTIFFGDRRIDTHKDGKISPELSRILNYTGSNAVRELEREVVLLKLAILYQKGATLEAQVTWSQWTAFGLQFTPLPFTGHPDIRPQSVVMDTIMSAVMMVNTNMEGGAIELLPLFKALR